MLKTEMIDQLNEQMNLELYSSLLYQQMSAWCSYHSFEGAAAFLRRHGTDVVVGSHPHVIQPWVADSSHVVLYSLGNLVSGQRRRYTDGGLVATVEAVRHPEGRMTYRLETTPVWVSVPGYRILTPEAADTMTLPAAYGIFRADLDALPGNGL